MDVAPLLGMARRLIVDAGVTQRVTDESFIQYLNEALAYMVVQNPYTLTGRVEWQTDLSPTSYHTVFNAASVSLPEGADSIVFVIDIPGLVLTDGNVLNLEAPGWRLSSTEGTLRHWVRSANSTAGFYTYPAAPGGSNILADCCLIPSEVFDSSDSLEGLRPELTPILVDYLVFRALSEDADNVTNQGLAAGHLARVDTLLQQLKAEDTARWNTQI